MSLSSNTSKQRRRQSASEPCPGDAPFVCSHNSSNHLSAFACADFMGSSSASEIAELESSSNKSRPPFSSAGSALPSLSWTSSSARVEAAGACPLCGGSKMPALFGNFTYFKLVEMLVKVSALK